MYKRKRNEHDNSSHDSDDELTIKPIENNSKDKIENPPLAEEHIIPKLNTSCLFIGSTGMGKSTLVTNFITKPQFYGGKTKAGESYFDVKLLISPTGDSDDVQKELGLSEDEVETDLTKAIEVVKELMKQQKPLVKKDGADKAPKILIMYDDVISHPKFTKHPVIIKSFIANRHYNFTVFFCSQSWTKIPRACRLQAKNIFYFAGSHSEVDKLCDEYCPAGLNRHDFTQLVDYATRDPYSFLYINKSVPMKKRFRKNLKEIIQTDYFKDSKHNTNFSLPEQEGEKDDEHKSENKKEDKVDEGDEGEQIGIPNPKTPKHRQTRNIVTSSQHGIPGTTNRAGEFRRSNFEQYATTYSQPTHKKRKNSHKSRSRRLESSYYT